MSMDKKQPPQTSYVVSPRWLTVSLLVSVMLACGASNTLILKVAFETRAVGINPNEDAHLFGKPWFMVFVMFLGQAIGLVAFMLQRTCAPDDEKCELTWWGIIWRSSIPAVLDLICTGLANMGLLYIAASQEQILQGWGIVFTALLSKLWLRRILEGRQLAGLGICVFALTIVGLAGILADASSGAGNDTNSNGSSFSSSLLGLLLCTGSQLFASAQNVWEEKVMKDVFIAPLLLVGVEGIIGMAVMCIVVFPCLSQIPGDDVGGIQESVWDTLAMLHHSSSLTALSLAFMCTVFVMNALSMYVTKILSALHLALVQSGLKTIVIWSVGLGLFYSTDGAHGEQWDWGPSLLKLAGFAMFLLGSLLYSQLIDFPCKRGIQVEASPRDLEGEEAPAVKVDENIPSATSQQAAFKGETAN